MKKLKFIQIMKKLFFLFAFAFSFLSLKAQKVDFKQPISYSKLNPTKTPTAAQSAFWYNTATGVLWRYDKTTAAWVTYEDQNYAELTISNDTLSISFAGTTPDTLEGFTASNLSGFTLDTDGGVLTYTGTETKKFLLTYSVSFTFAEAVVMNAYIQKSGSIVYPTRTRNLPATAGNTVNSAATAIITLTAGQTVSLFFVPVTHTGTDALTVYEAGVTLVEIK